MPDLQERADALRDMGIVPSLRDIDWPNVNRSYIARETGYSLSHISRVLAGKRVPSLDCAFDIASCMQITLDELWFNIWAKKAVNGRL